jgi:uncharacterized membrane protein YfcA
MEFAASWGQLAELAVAVLVAGAVSGLLAGLFGIGGGTVLVPVLYQGLELIGVDDAVRMQVSVGTSIAIIVPTAIQSFLAHRKRGAVDTQLLKDWLVPLPIGVIAASIVAAYISGGALRAIFAVVALLVAVRLLFNRESWRLGSDVPANPLRAIIGVVIGFLSTLMGIGGGVLNNTFMTLYGRPMHQAVATSSGVGVIISIPGIIGYIWAGWGAHGLPPLSTGFVNFPAVLILIPTSVLAAPYGVRLAHALSRRHLEIAFGCFLIFVAARFAWSLI